MTTLARPPRWSSHRSGLGHRPQCGDLLQFPRSWYVVLDTRPLDPSRSKYRYDTRLLIGRIAPETARLHAEHEPAVIIPCQWDNPRRAKRRT